MWGEDGRRELGTAPKLALAARLLDALEELIAMLLAIDVGNTETKLGIFEDGAESLRQKWRVTTELRRTPDEYGVFFTQLFNAGGIAISHVDAVAIASVLLRSSTPCSKPYAIASSA